MSIHDIFSNFQVTDEANLVSDSSIKIAGGTIPLALGIAPTAYFEGCLISDGDPTNITVMEIRYTNDPADVTGDQAAIDATSTPDPGTLGNSIIDLRTGLAPVLPYNTFDSGTMNFVANVVNPLSFKYAFLVINDTLDSYSSMLVTSMRGPLRYIAPKEEV